MFLLTDKTAWRLLLKTALGVFAVLIFRQFDFSYLVGAVALAVFLGIYLSEIQERHSLGRSFWVLVFVGLAGAKILSVSLPLFLGFIVLWTAGFFLVQGLVAFFFPNRELVYGVLNVLVLFFVFFIFFYLKDPGGFPLGVILFFFVAILFGEAFGFFGIAAPRRIRVFSACLAAVSLELAWILGFLPLGFVNSALFGTLVVFILRDAVVSHFRGFLNRNLVLKELVILWVFGLIIFAASRWYL